MFLAKLAARVQSNTQPNSPGLVLPFHREPPAGRLLPAHRFSVRDRICAVQWADSARSLGFTRMAIEPATESDDGESAEFLLIYAHGNSWATWGVACSAAGLVLWRSARGTTIGLFETLSAALAEIERLTPALAC